MVYGHMCNTWISINHGPCVRALLLPSQQESVKELVRVPTKHPFSMASWILTGTEGAQALMGDCISPGHADDQCAYCSKLTGLFALVSMVQLVCQLHHVTQGSITVSCEENEVLHWYLAPNFISSPTDAHFDLIIATHTIIQSCLI